MGVNENRQSGLDEAIQVGSAAAKVVEGAAKAGKITAAAANGTALGGPYCSALSHQLQQCRCMDLPRGKEAPQRPGFSGRFRHRLLKFF